MSFFQVLRESFKRIFTNPFKLLGLGFIVIVATFFGVLTPTAFNIMPDSMEDFPIAIVNEDQGAVRDGEKVNYGDDIIETVEDNDAVKWEVQEPGYFDKGINNTKYFAAFVIPEDFSKNAISAQNGTPHKAEIEYLSDIRKSYIFSQFSKSIKTQLIDIVGQSVSKEYVEGTFDNIFEIKDSLVEAADGSQQVTDGAGELKDGAGTLKTGTDKVHKGAVALEKGSSQIADGADTLNKAVQGIDVKGIDLTDEQKQAIQKAAATDKQVTGAADQLAGGIGQGVASTIKGQMTSSDAKSDAAGKVMSDSNVKQMIQVLVGSGYYTEEQAKAVVSGIVSATLDGAASKVSADTITKSISPSVTSTVTQVAGGSALSGAQGVAQEANKEIMKSAASLNELKKGTKTLADGTAALKANMGTMEKGAAQLADGAGKLEDGAGELQEGSQELTTGLNDGLDEIDDKLVNSSEAMGEFVSEPVVDKTTIFGELTRYSQGFSPLFMSLGLWVGSLLLFFVVPIRPRRDELVNAPKTVASGLLTAFVFGLMEAIMIFIGCNVIGLSPLHPSWLLLFLCFVSIAFITVIYMLCITFGLAGKLIAVLFTVFQIPCCAGSFPVQLMPDFFEKLNPFLPMTYAIDGIREAFSGTEISGMYYNSAMLCIFMAIALIVSLLVCKKTKKRTEYIEAQIAE
ncbi:MAG: YhgE/Pip domain-containing protein [Firmicutes bacterium]|nr:YhgE/Pip domain-containing protein [Bacillota bacterium]